MSEFWLNGLRERVMPLTAYHGKNSKSESKGRNEASPACFFLAIHPMVYVGGSLLYLVLCHWFFYRLKHPLNMMLAVALTVGHSWGSSIWLGLWLECD
jgi:hypothetical protein